jgi:hypothetical protein
MPELSSLAIRRTRGNDSSSNFQESRTNSFSDLLIIPSSPHPTPPLLLPASLPRFKSTSVLVVESFWSRLRRVCMLSFLVLLAYTLFMYLLGDEKSRGGAFGVLRRRIHHASDFPPTSLVVLSHAPVVATTIVTDTTGMGPLSPLNVIVVACGNPDPTNPDYFGLLNVKSLLMARAVSVSASTRRYNFFFVTNLESEEFLNVSQINFDVIRYIDADPLLTYTLIFLSEVDQISQNAGATNSPPALNEVFKLCAGVRLKFPFYFPAKFPHIKRAIYLDWDVIVTCDLITIWDKGREGWPESSLLSMAKNDPTGLSMKDSYRTPGPNEDIYGRHFPHPLVGGVSSGVIVWDFAAFTLPVRHDWWDLTLKIVDARVGKIDKVADYWILTNAFPLGDQDIINEMLSEREGWLALLAPEFNWCLADVLSNEDFVKSGIVRPSVCVYHLCGSRISSDRMRADPTLPDPAVDLSNFYRSANMPGLSTIPAPGMSSAGV